MKVITIKMIFGDEVCVGGKAGGAFLRRQIEAVIHQQHSVVLDFKGLDLITQGFCDEFLGPILQANGQEIFRQIKFRNCSEGVQAAILSTAHRFISDVQSISH